METIAKKLHTGRSRNDQVGADIRLYLRSQIHTICALLRDFQKALLTHAETHIETLIPGYTHLQRAQPLSLAHLCWPMWIWPSETTSVWGMWLNG